MYENLVLMRTATALAQHAGARQAIVAGNIANADTPGYRAMAMPGFAADRSGITLRQSRPGHVAPPFGTVGTPFESPAEPSPDGNSVSLEQEMLASVEAQRQHSRALAIWRHSISIIRTSLGR